LYQIAAVIEPFCVKLAVVLKRRPGQGVRLEEGDLKVGTREKDLCENRILSVSVYHMEDRVGGRGGAGCEGG
jgi:hypothetical protein